MTTSIATAFYRFGSAPPGDRVAAGANCATQEHGLATTVGRVSATGVAGPMLGGDSEWTGHRKWQATLEPGRRHMQTWVFEDFEVDELRFELRRAGSRVEVQPQVLEVLTFLVANHDRIVLKDELINHVWPGGFISDATLNSRIMSARKAINDSGKEQRLIRTVHGRGYRFVGPVCCPSLRGLGIARGRRRRRWLGQSFREDVKRFASGGVYLNFIGGEGQHRVRAGVAYTPSSSPLVSTKGMRT